MAGSFQKCRMRLIPFQSGEENAWGRWQEILHLVGSCNGWTEEEKVQATYDSLMGEALERTIDLKRPEKGVELKSYLAMLGTRFPAQTLRERMRARFFRMEQESEYEDIYEYSQRLRGWFKRYFMETGEYSRILKLHFVKTLENKELGKKLLKGMERGVSEIVCNDETGKMELKHRDQTFSEIIEAAERLEPGLFNTLSD